MQKVLFFEEELENKIIYNNFFLKKRDYLTLEEILNISEFSDEYLSDLKNEYKNSLKDKFYDVKSLKDAEEGHISFFINTKYKEDLENTKAGICILKERYKDSLPKNTIGIFVKNPHYVYAKLLNELFMIPQFILNPSISEKANIDNTTIIGKNVEIQAGVFIGKNVKIGEGCKICANAIINDDCIIDKNTFIGAGACISYSEIGQYCVIQNNANIGQCGFGFANNAGFNYKIPQLGIVKIGNFVEIGAGTCIDRGAVNNTIIGDNTKIDNLVHIAHGVKIGKSCFFAATVAVAGSTEFGDFVQIGGHAAINGHINIGTGSQIAGNSGVVKNVEPMKKVGGCPAINIRDWERINFKLIKLLTNEK